MNANPTDEPMNERHRRLLRVSAFCAFAIGISGLVPALLVAQTPAATPLEMRHFWHVFIAYAIAWVILAVWLWSIVRRLGRAEERLSRLDGSGGSG